MTRKSLADILNNFLVLLPSPVLISVPLTHCTAIHATRAGDLQQSHELKRLHGTVEALVAAALDVQTPEAESSAGVLSFGFETTKLPGRPFVDSSTKPKERGCIWSIIQKRLTQTTGRKDRYEM
ncbi:hypothetical protein ARMGADRAFT_1022837 [Armillaria gallica]|uniref:Uncharacterized protein n=1 Tax=Armillaria gallica TaxID=47427 RepID=A0A2H3EAF0_ARMGA|nr:hypothetical protein ARMGADRAFT_1022837 [Armillaria gallica]